jgi:exonuclease III
MREAAGLDNVFEALHDAEGVARPPRRARRPDRQEHGDQPGAAPRRSRASGPSRRKRRRKYKAAREEFVKKTAKNRGSYKIGGLNCQGGLKDNIAELEEFASEGKYDVVVFTDTKLKPRDKLSAKGYKVYRQAAEFETGEGGVAILVADHVASGATVLDSVADNQLWIRIAGTKGRRDQCICGAYMPQESAKKAAREDLWRELEATGRRLSADADLVIVGDLNAKLRSPTTGEEERRIGKHGETGDRTPNGRLLYGVMRRLGLVSLIGQNKPPGTAGDTAGVDFWWTRHDKPTKTHHTIDYVLVSDGLMDGVTKCWVDYTHLNSDHHLIGALVPCPRAVVRKRGRRRPRRRFRTEKLIQRSSAAEDVEEALRNRASYEENIVKEFEGFNPYEAKGTCECEPDMKCVCAGVEDFIRRTEAALEATVGSVQVGRKFSRSWFDDEARSAISARKAAYAKYLEARGTDGAAAAFGDFVALRRASNRVVRRKKQEDWTRTMNQMEEAFRKDHKKLWDLIGRFLKSGKKAEMAPVQRQDGTIARSEQEILEAWAAHQEKLGTPKAHELEDTAFAKMTKQHMDAAAKLSKKQEKTTTTLDRPFTDEQVQAGVENLQYHKAGTEDGTTNPMYACGGKAMAKRLRILFNFLRDREAVHTDWQRSVVCNLYKEGDRTDPGNFRGIALISCLGKLYLSLWARRLADHAEGFIDDSQGGFRRRRSTVDLGLAVHEGLLRRKRAGQSTFACFVDFRKAFDTVWHDGLWKVLWGAGVRGKSWRIIRQLYSDTRACVLLNGQTTREVRMRQGVRQGCPLSPILFNYFINELAKELRESGAGLTIEGLDLGALLYADDVILMAESQEKLQALVDVVDRFCRKWHMDINLGKSKIMVFGRKGCLGCKASASAARKRARLTDEEAAALPATPPCVFCSCMCRGAGLQVVDEYKYLGIWLTKDLLWETHIRKTEERAKESTAGLADVLNNKRLPASAKALAWLARVRPKLEYGSEVWEANSKQAARLESIQIQAAVKVFKLNEKVKTHAARALMRVPPLKHRRKVQRLKYLAKTMTMPQDRLVRRLIHLPPVKPTQGRSRPDHWLPRVEGSMDGGCGEQLRDRYKKLQASQARNQGVLPRGADPTVHEYDYYPVRSWHNELRRWLQQVDVDEFREEANKPRSTLATMVRATSRESERVPAFPLTRAPNRGQNQIRLRFLCGTSALNESLSRYRTVRDAACPYSECNEARESVQHFLLHCAATEDLRRDYTDALTNRCECDRRIGEGGVLGCEEFFASLDDAGKALFMLGGPVDDRVPEAAIDEAAKDFVARAYERRKEKLNSVSETPLVEDLTKDTRRTMVSNSRPRPAPASPPSPSFVPLSTPPVGIRAFFPRVACPPVPAPAPPAAPAGADEGEDQVQVSPHASNGLEAACTHACACTPAHEHVHGHPRARTRTQTQPARSNRRVIPMTPRTEKDSMTIKLREAL